MVLQVQKAETELELVWHEICLLKFDRLFLMYMCTDYIFLYVHLYIN